MYAISYEEKPLLDSYIYVKPLINHKAPSITSLTFPFLFIAKTMATSKLFSCFLVPPMLLLLDLTAANAQLRVWFYEKTCPNAEKIVKEVMNQVMSVAPSLSGPLLRMHFHGCFVRVCF